MRRFVEQKLTPLRTTTFVVIVLAVLAGGAGAEPSASLTPHTAEYKVRISGVSGILATSLSVDEHGAYTATHAVRATGLARLLAGRGRIEEQSVFSVDSGALIASQYRSKDELSREKGTIQLTFDSQAQRLEGVIALEDAPEVAIDSELTGPLFDRVSVQYQLMLDFLSETHQQVDTPISDEAVDPDQYVIFDIDGNKTVQITRIGERSIRYRGDTVRALGVRHQSSGSSRKTELWLAPDLDYLPILIEQYRKDKLKLRATLRSYTPRVASGGD
ncbi:MAG: DUF3108 domain-containing protein [Pseudomonadota bacterium]